MRILHTGLLTVVLVAAGGPAAVPGSSAHGQSATPRTRVAPRSFEVLSARGGEIGVTIRDLEAGDLKGAAGAERGVRVDAVAEDSPAAKAGIAKGDVLVEFDGEQVRSARQFARLVSETPPGRQVSVALLRDGRRMTVAVEPRAGSGLQLFDFPDLHGLENLNRDFALRLRPPVPPTPPAAPAPPAPPAPPALPDFPAWVWRTGNTLGVTVQDLSEQLADYFGATDGVLVTSVADGSAADKAGLKAGDVITSLNGSSVGSSGELRQRLQRLGPGDEITVDVVRDRKPMSLKGKLEDQRPRRTFKARA